MKEMHDEKNVINKFFKTNNTRNRIFLTVLFLAVYTKIEVKYLWHDANIFTTLPRILRPLYRYFLKRKYERLYFKSIV